MSACLDGIRVVELARFQAVPGAGMLLSDLGAEVIKIEPPGGEETRRMPPLVRGQNEHTEEVLGNLLGYERAAVERLRRAGAIA